MNDTLLEQMRALVRSPTVSSVHHDLDMGNRAAVDLLAGWLEDIGFRCELLPLDESGKKANLVATRGRGEGGLVLSGHSDTVPFDEPLWSSDPLDLVERDGALRGLGSCDMKGFLAIAVEAARRVADVPLARPLVILATADEESGMDGARALALRGIPGVTRAIIGEPTSMRPIRMHKGVSMERLVLVGRSGHSSDPSLGASALEGMRLALAAIARVRDEIAREHRNEALVPPHATMNLGRIAGGDNPNRICGRCELSFDLRVLPGMDEAAVRGRVHRAVAAAIEGLGLTMEAGPLHEAIPPFETSGASEIVRVAEAMTGSESGGVSFGTEAPFLSRMGLETIVLGPGDIACAHQPDEHLPLASIEPCLDVLGRMIGRFCVERA